jgi:hypothetical protein
MDITHGDVPREPHWEGMAFGIASRYWMAKEVNVLGFCEHFLAKKILW